MPFASPLTGVVGKPPNNPPHWGAVDRHAASLPARFGHRHGLHSGTVRIVSLLPSATDLVCMIGLRDSLVGRTHECDWPPGIEAVPAVTADNLATHAMRSREIHEAIGGTVHSGSSVYHLDTAALEDRKSVV